jgi:hypothetical protein
MATITVKRVDEGTFDVTVDEVGSATTHTVTADADTITRIGGGIDAERVVDASFRFLLDREPKEAILRRFDLPVIADYWPEYPHEITTYLTDG